MLKNLQLTQNGHNHVIYHEKFREKNIKVYTIAEQKTSNTEYNFIGHKWSIDSIAKLHYNLHTCMLIHLLAYCFFQKTTLVKAEINL